MSRLYFYSVALSLVLFEGTSHAQTLSGDQLKKSILVEWNSLLKTINTSQWEARIEYYSSRAVDPDHPESVDVTQHAFNHDAGSLWSEKIDDSRKQRKPTEARNRVVIQNRQYKAELNRLNEGDVWLLAQLKLELDEAPEWLRGSDRCPWMMVVSTSLDQLLQEGNFAVTRVEELQGQPPTGCLRAHFSHDQSPSSLSQIINLSQSIKSGYIDFDPTHSYRPISYHFDIKSELEEGVIWGALEYENGKGIPVLKLMTQMVESHTKRKGLVVGKEIHTFSNVTYNGDVPKERFRLTYYGLPEPPGLGKSPTRWPIWATLAGIICLGLAAALFLWKARRRGPSPLRKRL